MEEKYLVINCGSSSLKFSLYEMPSEKIITKGYIEKIGLDDSFWTITYNDNKISGAKKLDNHSEAVRVMIDELINNKIISNYKSKIYSISYKRKKIGLMSNLMSIW